MMNLRLHLVIGLSLFMGPVSGNAAPLRSDVPPPAKRDQMLELARGIAQRVQPAALPADMVQPFNPVAFGQPDPEELQAIAAARAAANLANAQAKPATDSDLLKLIAARVAPSGTVILGGEPMLIFGKKRLRIGDHLTVAYDGHDYDVELVGITRTSFSLRLNGNEITRPLKPGKSP